MVHATPPKTPKISLINFKHNQTNMSIDVNKLFSPVKNFGCRTISLYLWDKNPVIIKPEKKWFKGLKN